mgnify:CR=1 FL=1
MSKKKLTSTQIWRILNPHRYYAIKLKYYYQNRAVINEMFSLDPNYRFQPEKESRWQKVSA